MAEASNRYLMDGLDLYETYGLIVSEGSDDFLFMPRRKDPLSHDWRDQNGTEYDLSTPVFEVRQATIKCWLLANGEEEFWDNYKALFAHFKMPGSRSLNIVEFEQSFDIMYLETVSVSRLTRIKNSSKVGVSMELRFTILGGGALMQGDGAYYYGPVDAFPTTWAGITSLASNQYEGQGSVINLQTGTVKTKFALALRQVRSLTKVIDLNASNSDITDAYTTKSSNIDNGSGVMYKVLGLDQILPYSTNHVHQIIIL